MQSRLSYRRQQNKFLEENIYPRMLLVGAFCFRDESPCFDLCRSGHVVGRYSRSLNWRGSIAHKGREPRWGMSN